MSRCRSCSADIIWARTSRGKLMPINPQPHPNGNITLSDDQSAGDVLFGAKLAHAVGARLTLYRSHYANCPGAGEWRQR